LLRNSINKRNFAFMRSNLFHTAHKQQSTLAYQFGIAVK
jgi:hypothetical protein